jgi:hypothetical protein
MVGGGGNDTCENIEFIGKRSDLTDTHQSVVFLDQPNPTNFTILKWLDVQINTGNATLENDSYYTVPSDGLYYVNSQLHTSGNATLTDMELKKIGIDGNTSGVGTHRGNGLIKAGFTTSVGVLSLSTVLDLKRGEKIFSQAASRSGSDSTNIRWYNMYVKKICANGSGTSLPTCSSNNQILKYDTATTSWKCAADNASIGVGQTWQDVKSSRAIRRLSGETTSYTNDTGKPIMVSVSIYSGSSGNRCQSQIIIDGVGGIDLNLVNNASGAAVCSSTAIVPPGSTYAASGEMTPAATATEASLHRWVELR